MEKFLLSIKLREKNKKPNIFRKNVQSRNLLYSMRDLNNSERKIKIDTSSQFKTSINKSLNIENISVQNTERTYTSSLRKTGNNLVKEKTVNLINEKSTNSKSKGKIRRRIKSPLYKKTPRIFYQKDEIIKNTLRENTVIKSEPTNNIELNKILINSFGFNTSLKASYKLISMCDKYFNILETMKRRRTRLQLEKFEKLKKSFGGKSSSKKSRELQYLSTLHREEKWAKKYFKKKYNDDKLSESDYIIFKNKEKLKTKKKIHYNAKKFTELIFGIDSQPYELKNENENTYESSKDSISFKNLERVIRLREIQKTGKDYENNDFGLEVNDKGKDENKKIKDELILTLGQLGPPKFIKCNFRNSTLRKFQTVCGNLMGS